MKNIPSLVSTNKSIYNYKLSSPDTLSKLIKQLANILKIKDTDDKYSVIVNCVNWQLGFEWRKDLYRLYSINNDEEKARIIYRLKDCYNVESYKIINIIFEYIKDINIRNRLLANLFTFQDKIEPLQMLN